MSKPTDIGPIPVNAGQAFSFGIAMVGAAADAAAFTGMVITAQIRSGAPPTTPLVTPTVSLAAPVVTADTVTVVATISWTKVQAALLPCGSSNFTMPQSYAIDIEGAYSDAPTVPAFRFFGSVDVYQGGVV